MAVTIKDVAREAGVSFSTVSKVVNNSPFISEATALRVKEVIERMNYTPNVRAANFKRRSTRSIAFLSLLHKGEAYANPHMFEFFCGVHRELARKGYSITFMNVSGDKKPGDTLKAVFSAGGYDGVIIHGWALNHDTATMLVKESFPHVVMGKPAFESQVCWIDTNNILAGDIAARHLIEGGSQNIAFIGGDRNDTISMRRLSGVRAVLRGFGLKMPESNVLLTDASLEESRLGAAKLLSQDKRPDGIICSCNPVAIGVLEAVREAGLSMPSDLQLITFDAYPFTHIMNPSPTVVNTDFFEQGEQTASQLLKSIKNPALRVQSYVALPELIARGTTNNIL
ncbi:MAG: LacI family transcriptional regulator [Lachnospiraceae bacterium]|nr:LacI family transcriptional regulator [Lachnospiraceae bacterium]